jgi:hypothetical protein
MSNYDFSTLNPTDFEKLVCDLLNKHIDGNNYAKYRSFKEGKDRGIDLLFSTKDNDFEIIVQVKHYIKSSFSKLKHDLIKIESDKVQKLNPKQYIFVTSQELSIHNKEEIRNIFTPYITSLEDIFGRDDLNDLLRLHPDIEERHFKLWFSSTAALKKLLNYRLEGRNNEFSENELKRKLRLFVSTEELVRAKYLLDINKFLIITGEPGVGKTTLSEILLYKFLSKDFELTVIYDDIKEVEYVLKNDNSKQLFYFDDFLGHTQAEINKSKSAEISLLKIISRIEKLENKYLILNTRKFILNTFLEESERFRNFFPLRSENKIELYSYSYGAKRRMLDNHLFESGLDDILIQEIKKSSFFICTHQNFSPRHIEFFTTKLYIDKFKPNELQNFIIDNLVNPKRIWEHAYLNQITDYERFFLNTLYSLGGDVGLIDLENTYNSRLNFETKNNNFPKPLNSFNDCLKKLDGGFININNIRDSHKVSFINPSLEDFLHYSIDNNISEIERILFSAINVNQFYYFFKPFFDKEVDINDNLINFFTANYDKIISRNPSDENLYKSAIFIYFFQKNTTYDTVSKILINIKNWDFLKFESSTKIYSVKFLQSAKSKKMVNDTISDFKLEFYVYSLLSTELIEELIEMIHLFEKHYGFNFRYTFEDSDNSLNFKNQVDDIYKLCQNLFQDEINTQYDFLMTNTEYDAHIDVIYRIKEYESFFKEFMFSNFQMDYLILTGYNWNSLVETNLTDLISLNLNKEYDNYDDDEYSFEEYDSDYDYEKDKLNFNSVKITETYGSYDDLPF